jgi:hypothetical protein
MAGKRKFNDADMKEDLIKKYPRNAEEKDNEYYERVAVSSHTENQQLSRAIFLSAAENQQLSRAIFLSTTENLLDYNDLMREIEHLQFQVSNYDELYRLYMTNTVQSESSRKTPKGPRGGKTVAYSDFHRSMLANEDEYPFTPIELHGNVVASLVSLNLFGSDGAAMDHFIQRFSKRLLKIREVFVYYKSNNIKFHENDHCRPVMTVWMSEFVRSIPVFDLELSNCEINVSSNFWHAKLKQGVANTEVEEPRKITGITDLVISAFQRPSGGSSTAAISTAEPTLTKRTVTAQIKKPLKKLRPQLSKQAERNQAFSEIMGASSNHAGRSVFVHLLTDLFAFDLLFKAYSANQVFLLEGTILTEEEYVMRFLFAFAVTIQDNLHFIPSKYFPLEMVSDEGKEQEQPQLDQEQSMNSAPPEVHPNAPQNPQPQEGEHEVDDVGGTDEVEEEQESDVDWDDMTERKRFNAKLRHEAYLGEEELMLHTLKFNQVNKKFW